MIFSCTLIAQNYILSLKKVLEKGKHTASDLNRYNKKLKLGMIKLVVSTNYK